MSKVLSLGVAAVLTLSAGCVSAPPNPQSLIPVDRVMNSVICGLVQAAAGDSGGDLYQQRVSITLALQVVSDASAGIGFNSSGGGSGGGGKGGSSAKVVSASSSLLPSLGFSSSQQWTTTHKLGLVIEAMPSQDTWRGQEGRRLLEDCNRYLPPMGAGAAGSLYVDNFAFHQWITENLKAAAAMIRVGNAKPWSSIDTKFAVTNSGSVSAQVPILTVIPLGANASASKNDVQQLSVVVGKAPQSSGRGGQESIALPNVYAATPGTAVKLQNLKLRPFY